jgi:hypothetical protein
MEKTGLPKGYTLVEDVRLAGYTTPPGFRVERNDTRRRMRASPENRVVGIKAGPEYRRALDTCIARMKAVEGLGEAGVGSFVWYAKTGAQPSLLAEVYARDRRWAWIPSLGGYVRLAAEESEPLRPLMDFKAGEFAGCTNRGRTPGFASVTHLGFDTPRIRVRLPEPEVIWAARSGLAPAPVIEADRERAELQAEIRKAIGDGCPNADEVLEWMKSAPVSELREWLASGVEGGAK